MKNVYRCDIEKLASQVEWCVHYLTERAYYDTDRYGTGPTAELVYDTLSKVVPILDEVAKKFQDEWQSKGLTPAVGPDQVNTIPPDQRWYWTPAWQESERQADDDERAGRYFSLSSLDKLQKVE